MPQQAAVDAWFSKYENPMKAVVQAIRQIVLDADPRIDECIKWQAPTFTYRGNLASFFPKSQHHASLMFHLGAQIPGDYPSLEGSGDVARVLKVDSLDQAAQARPELERMVRAWCDWRESVEAAPAGRAIAQKPRTKKKASAGKPTRRGASRKAAPKRKKAIRRR